MELESKKVSKKRHLLFPIFIFLFIFFLVITIIFITMIFISMLELKIKNEGQKVNAEIIDIINTGSLLAPYWDLQYYYEDENGLEYRGTITTSYNNIETAQEKIGTKVEIYIDGKGQSIYFVDDYKPLRAIIFSIVSAIIAGLLLFFCILPRKKKEKN